LRTIAAITATWWVLASIGLRPPGALAADAPKAISADVDGVVHPITAEIVSAAIESAARQHAALVIIRLNTPGGLMDATRATIERIVSSPVPVVTFVEPSGARAASAGFFLLEAGDVAAMAPGTSTGAAHPVLLVGEMDAVMKQKVANDAAAYLRSICTQRGRNSATAEQAVLESKSFSTPEALAHRLVDLVARDESDLLAQLDGREITRFDGRKTVLRTAGAAIEVYDKTLRQRIIAAIADPNIALVLLIVGALAIYVEFTAPGLIAPGAIGAILVLLGLSALSVLPINALGAALLLAAFILFVLEAKFAAHGILGICGATAMVLGAVLLVDSPLPELRVRWSTAFALAIPFSLITVFLLSIAVRARRNKVETGPEGMIGQRGVAITPLEPEGTILVHGEYWNAAALQPIARGAPVRVTAVAGLKLTVEPVPRSVGGNE